ncbi:Nucleolar GTP-binding protein 1 [Forsythia ovata]|uniref:Nucleolar GTP-binding protein 1 n=1 Tax=Forsythia ovata TaxID=205694 RepID=A0ABD1TQV5_9LAMI
MQLVKRLLDQRAELKIKSKKLNDFLNHFHVAMPKQRDQKERPPCIPKAVLEAKAKKAEQAAEKQIKLEKNLEDENGDASLETIKEYTLKVGIQDTIKEVP